MAKRLLLNVYDDDEEIILTVRRKKNYVLYFIDQDTDIEFTNHGLSIIDLVIIIL